MKYDTTYTNMRGEEFEAIQIPWWEVEELLERTHEGHPDDDEELVRYLITNGYPEWVRDAEGWTDENGWGLIGPKNEEAAQ